MKKYNRKIISGNSWENIDEYLNYIKIRLVEMKRVLKDIGSIFLHCDKIASHYLRVLLDEVFGFNNFRSEIIWSYKRWSNSKKGLLNGALVGLIYIIILYIISSFVNQNF